MQFFTQVDFAADEFRATHSLYRKSASWIIASQKQAVHFTALSFTFVFATSAFPRFTRSAYAKSAVLDYAGMHFLIFRFRLLCNLALKTSVQLASSQLRCSLYRKSSAYWTLSVRNFAIQGDRMNDAQRRKAIPPLRETGWGEG